MTVPGAGVLFTGDLVETGQFSIFPALRLDPATASLAVT